MPEKMTRIKPFFDTHTHLLDWGISLNRPNLSNCRSFDQIQEKMAEWGWTGSENFLVGVDFDETIWKDKRVPTLKAMNGAFPDEPVILRRACGHVAVANSPALDLIGDEWEIVHRTSGKLEEDVVLHLNKVVGISYEEMEKGAKRSVEEAFKRGLAGSAEIINKKQFKMLKTLDRVRDFIFKAFLPYYDLMELLSEGEAIGPVTGNLHLGGVKIFVDGSIGARTAALSDDYTDRPGNRGLLLIDEDELCKRVERCEDEGVPMMVHAIGDRAISTVLAAMEKKMERGNPLGHKLEHAEVLTPKLIRRMADLGLRVSMQPNFAGRWSGPGSMNLERLGKKRHRWCNPYRSVMNAGVKTGFGSDCMPLGPLFGIWSAVNHPVKEERISLPRALNAYTVGSANFLGLNAGNDSYVEIAGDMSQGDAGVVKTVIRGKEVFRR